MTCVKCYCAAAHDARARWAHDFGDPQVVVHAWEPACGDYSHVVWRSHCGIVCGGARLIWEEVTP